MIYRHSRVKDVTFEREREKMREFLFSYKSRVSRMISITRVIHTRDCQFDVFIAKVNEHCIWYYVPGDYWITYRVRKLLKKRFDFIRVLQIALALFSFYKSSLSVLLLPCAHLSLPLSCLIHITGIKKPKKHAKKSLKGMDPKFLRNQKFCKKHNKVSN